MVCCYRKKSASQNDEKSFLWLHRPNLIFWVLKKIMMPSESSWIFFIKSVRVMRASVAESFSLASEDHCKRGRFLMELLYNIDSKLTCWWTLTQGSKRVVSSLETSYILTLTHLMRLLSKVEIALRCAFWLTLTLTPRFF
jgi:hypothetical protein